MAVLNLDTQRIQKIRDDARTVALGVQEYIDSHTTTTVERATLRLMGIDGADADDAPYPNLVVEHLGDAIDRGAAAFVANGVLHTGLDAQAVAEACAEGSLNLRELPMQDAGAVQAKAAELVAPQVERIAAMKAFRQQKTDAEPPQRHPLLYVIVATGNIYDDVDQAKSAARNGAEIVAVIRTTAQSLLDFVPYHATDGGFGGTYATQENFRIMRSALDEVGEELGRYIRLVNYASGLCMPEISTMGALERLDMMLNDSMYGILFRDINMYRTFVDQHFSRMVNALAGIVINTGEDNYLTTADAIDNAYTVLASDFINEQFACLSGLQPNLMGLGHAFEINPEVENSFLYELAHAWTVRECFPEAPLKYMPPTKFMTGDIFKGYMLNTMFNLAGQMTGQGIQLLGMLTEALHTPHLHDRFLACANARYVMNAAKDLSDQFTLKEDSFIAERARRVLDEAGVFMEELTATGLMDAIEQGRFADITRPRNGGKGRQGVYAKDAAYFNPMYDVFRAQLPGVHLK